MPRMVQSAAAPVREMGCHSAAGASSVAAAITSVSLLRLRYVSVFMFFRVKPLLPRSSSHFWLLAVEGADRLTPLLSALRRRVLPSTSVLRV